MKERRWSVGLKRKFILTYKTNHLSLLRLSWAVSCQSAKFSQLDSLLSTGSKSNQPSEWVKSGEWSSRKCWKKKTWSFWTTVCILNWTPFTLYVHISCTVHNDVELILMKVRVEVSQSIQLSSMHCYGMDFGELDGFFGCACCPACFCLWFLFERTKLTKKTKLLVKLSSFLFSLILWFFFSLKKE